SRNVPSRHWDPEEPVRRAFLAAGVLTLLAIATLVWARGLWRQSNRTAGRGQIARVGRRGIGNVVKATGIIKPPAGADVRVGPRFSGGARRLYARVGDRAGKGHLLAELDDRDLVARREEAEAALQQAEVSLTYATTDFQRKRQLAIEGVLARSELD